MPQTCCVLGCANRSGRDKVVFFKFPRNNILKEKWITAIKRHNFIPTYHRICNIHFTEYDFVERPDIKRLKETAVPTLFIGQEKFNVDAIQLEHSYCQFSKPNVEIDNNCMTENQH